MAFLTGAGGFPATGALGVGPYIHDTIGSPLRRRSDVNFRGIRVYWDVRRHQMDSQFDRLLRHAQQSGAVYHSWTRASNGNLDDARCIQ
jgi:hypothetical protein